MSLFFQRFTGQPIHISLEEIVPKSDTPHAVAKRAVYRGLIDRLPSFIHEQHRHTVESALRPFRKKAAEGALASEDFTLLEYHFRAFKADFLMRYDAFDAYKELNNCAALIACMLFVDNCAKQGLAMLSDEANSRTHRALTSYIQELYQRENVPVDLENAAFHALYFLAQTMFDRIFVGDEEIVWHDQNSGELHRTPNYDRFTAYLELSNSKLVTACDAERSLCYQITTGWGAGIDLDTWNALNKDYYSRSDDNFFSADYDDHLEKMLPQFPYGKARAAAEIVRDWDGETLHLVEIGAGSGGFAIDLFMAIKFQGKDMSRLHYHGVEPSGAMNQVFHDQFMAKTGGPPPEHWRMELGSLETFLDAPSNYLDDHQPNQVVFSYSAHHCYGQSMARFFSSPAVGRRVVTTWILDGTREHGWTKMYYMALDCRSPENFENVAVHGSWNSTTCWHEPEKPLDHHALTRAWCALRKITPPAARIVEQGAPAVLLDLDGTVYRGEALIPEALDFVNWLQRHKIPLMFLTNRSERTPETVVNHLTRLGFQGIDTAHIYTSAQATADSVAPCRAWFIGDEGLELALRNAGFELVDDQPEVVFVGLDQAVDYQKLNKAVTFVLAGARLVITNPDRKLNTDHGFGPGNGAIASAITTATGVPPLVIGKPEPHMFEAAARKLGVPSNRCLVVGDNLETDIRGGIAAGCHTALVLTGVSSESSLAGSELVPDLVVPDLAVLRDLLAANL